MIIYQDKIIARAFDADKINNRYRAVITIEDALNWMFYASFCALSHPKELKTPARK
jgi:hypothetical protein